ncbi:MAG: hypothetical protein QM488_00555 [Rhizobiaceae bacterium]
MSIISRREALALVPAAITTLVPFSAAARAITVRKICPTERFWQNFLQARCDFETAGAKPGAENADTFECAEAFERMHFNESLLLNAQPTTIGGMIALSEYLQDFMEQQPDADQIVIVSNLIASLKQLPAGLTYYSHDISGAVVPTDDLALAGALQ